MAEGRMAEIMGETSGLDDIRIESAQRCDLLLIDPRPEQLLGQAPADLCDLQRMCEPVVNQVTIRRRRHLCDAGQTSERRRVENAVAISSAGRSLIVRIVALRWMVTVESFAHRPEATSGTPRSQVVLARLRRRSQVNSTAFRS